MFAVKKISVINRNKNNLNYSNTSKTLAAILAFPPVG
jgi:hypothetical protein